MISAPVFTTFGGSTYPFSVTDNGTPRVATYQITAPSRVRLFFGSSVENGI